MATSKGPQAINGIRALQAMLPIIGRTAVEEVMQVAQEEAKLTTAFKNYTGRLRASIRGGIQEASYDKVTGVLTAGTDDAGTQTGWELPSRVYSAYVELGMSNRPPHAFIAPTMRTIASRGLLAQAVRRRMARIMARGVM